MIRPVCDRVFGGIPDRVRLRFPVRMHHLLCVVVLAVVASLLSAGVSAQEGPELPDAAPAAPAAGAAAGEPGEAAGPRTLPLDIGQQAVLGRFDRFEQELLKMAEQMRRQDPERSDLLFRAHSRSQQEQIISQMRVIFEQLSRQDISFGDAIQRQEALIASMKTLLEVLQSENRIGDIEAERQRIQGIIKDVNRLLGNEKDARALTERGGDPEQAARKQEDIERKAAELIESVEKHDAARQAEETGRSASQNGESKSGKSGEQQPPDGDSSGKGEAPDPNGDEEPKPNDGSRIQKKQPDGQQQNGTEGDPSPDADSQDGRPESPSDSGSPGEQNSQQPGSSGQQQDSQQQQTPGRQQLEQARDEMQRAIEELRRKNDSDASKHQDEAIRRLLEAREKLEEILRQLREEEKSLMLTSLESRFRKMLTEQLLIYQDTVQLAAKGDEEPNLEPRARQLARRENDIVQEVNKAMILLQEEGSSVAFPEAVEAIRDDMQSIVRLLDDADVGELTQTVEQGVIEALEEMIDALNQEMQKQNEEQDDQQGQPGQPSAPGEEPLVDALSELKMLRSLQLRINRRTQQLSRLAEGPEALNPELIDQLKTLSRRQARIQRATFDLSTGRNQ